MENNLEILSNHENYELNVCRQNINLFNKYIVDYENLRHRLNNLADKTSHDIMVPIGGSKLAFMPGYINHTNEILVLIGNNYFVEKSSKETIAFIDRRIEFCKEKLNKLEKQKSMLIKWLETTENFKEESDQLVNITETCTDEEFDQWMKEHNKKAKEANAKINKDRPKTKLDFDFEKYEKQEAENNEIEQEQANQPLQLNVVEKIFPNVIQENQKSFPSTNNLTLSQRPVSKFKASRNKN